MTKNFIPKKQLQKEVYAAWSEMYGREAPLYKLLLAVNRHVNEQVAKEQPELGITPEQLDDISSERHGAIRLATPEEFKTMTRFFEVMDMQPHEAYLMTGAGGGKAQPLIGTGFRSKQDPSQRMFCSTLMLDTFDEETQARMKKVMKDRDIFEPALRTLIRKNEKSGGLTREEANDFIKESKYLVRWSGRGHDLELYNDLKSRGHGVAADIVCFRNPHLNHLTPNSLDIDRLTETMRKILSAKSIKDFPPEVQELIKHISEEEKNSYLNNNGFKPSIEGPPKPKPGNALVFLRQVSYNALPEKALFGAVEVLHTARFGEIEQRGVALTQKGRAIYDECLKNALEKIDPKLAEKDYPEYEKQYASYFKPLEKTIDEIRKEGLGFFNYEATEKGSNAARSGELNREVEKFLEGGKDNDALLNMLVDKGFLNAVPSRYDDFLPVSAAGIFSSNLGGKQSEKPLRTNHTKKEFEETTGVKIIDTNTSYAGRQALAVKTILDELGLKTKFGNTPYIKLKEQSDRYEKFIEGGGNSLAA